MGIGHWSFAIGHLPLVIWHLKTKSFLASEMTNDQ
jgi:hypothetical protein